jgi:Rod binding domain-containing protein
MSALIAASAPGLASLSALPEVNKAASKTPEAMDKAAKEFESVFLAQMLQHMFSGVSFSTEAGTGGEDGEGSGDDVYKNWMTDQYGKMIADHGGIGVADYVKRELMHLQEVKS